VGSFHFPEPEKNLIQVLAARFEGGGLVDRQRAGKVREVLFSLVEEAVVAFPVVHIQFVQQHPDLPLVVGGLRDVFAAGEDVGIHKGFQGLVVVALLKENRAKVLVDVFVEGIQRPGAVELFGGALQVALLVEDLAEQEMGLGVVVVLVA